MNHIIGLFNSIGYCGVNLTFYSYVGNVYISLVSDEKKIANPRELVDIIVDKINDIHEKS